MFDEIKEIILEFAEPDFEITEETLLKSDLALTSFDLVCIADRLGALKGSEIPAKDFRMCRTIGDLCACITAKEEKA